VTAMPKIRFRLEMSCVIQNSDDSMCTRRTHLQPLCLAKLLKVHELSECRTSRIEIWKSDERKFSDLTQEQDRQCTYNVELGCFRVNNVAVLVQLLCILSVCL
jgi:hypothetical protein